MSSRTVEVLPDAGAVARRGAAIVADRARTAVAERGRFLFAVSGGATPRAMFAHLADEDVPWDAVTIFQVDERVAPAGDPDRNLTHLLASLPLDAELEIRAMEVEDADLDGAASAYERSLPETLDLVHLGVGADGHTASLVHGDPVLDVTDRAVAVTAPYQGRRRMTLTYAGLARAREVLWLVAGSEKADALARLLADDASIPATRISVPRQLVLADEAAARA